MTESAQQPVQTQSEDSLSLKDLFYLCLNKWYWFVLALVIALGIAGIYLLTTPPTYTRSAELLVKEDSKGNSLSGGMEQTFADMGLFKVNTNVQNEIIALKSVDLMYEVVKRLNLDVNYMVDGRFHDKIAYGTNLPIHVDFLDLDENESGKFTLEIGKDSKLSLKDFVTYENGKEVESKNKISGNLSDTLSTPLGRMIVTRTSAFVSGKKMTFYISKAPKHAVTRSYASRLEVVLTEKQATVISLSFKDGCTQRADDVLNTIIAVYNENWVRDKNQIAVSTSMFIDERLAVIERELGNVDENISTFKSENLLPDVQAVSDLYLTENSQTNAQIMDLNNQLYMAKYIRAYLMDKDKQEQLLPAISGIGSAFIESQISEYNSKLLQRNGLVANSSEKNPLVVDIDQALLAIRKAIISSLDNQIETLNTQISSLQRTEQHNISRIAANPNQAKYLLSVERQQKVKESLYLFLLQKREENELSQAFTAYNTRVITKPNGTSKPSAPKKSMIILVAFVLGLVIPIAVIFIRESMNTKVRGRKDLANLTIPFIGEIPLYYHRKKTLFSKKPVDVKAIVVKEGSRNIINEAFRVLRTNLEFMAENDKNSNIILITSFNPQSGKSFLSMNLGMSLAINEKKVLIIDGDMRHASVSSYVNSPKHGLSEYLNGRIDNLNDIIVTDSKYENLHILPVGTLPPNPTELLQEGRLTDIVNTVKNMYDYVLIDCPPVELVADTQIIEKLADRTIFVVRAGLMERGMLNELQNIYNKKEYKNMALVLNGTEGAGGRYGYQYGYHYGYRYGYHYGYSSNHYYTDDESQQSTKKNNKRKKTEQEETGWTTKE